ncbi:MAG: FAD-dependent oxidoreductase [Candidatus Omnitrophica bacterium]|nr:FAD-dependent oxidoreductase [Candidatus Omnitrophota bacterium]MCM8799418.1 FAD-dependent oxidoreductase [Candidatus Omnitrophota bacterium]
MPEIFKIRFKESIIRTPTVESFRFIPEKKINFIPGQFLQVIFDKDNLNNRELNKFLSFSSSPTKDYIEVTKRISESKFSQRLKDLKPDDEIFIKGPLGSCVFDESYKRIGFLIGGIGITPVVSILEYIDDRRISTDVLLFYSNRTDSETAFKNELDKISFSNPKVKIIYLVTDCLSLDKNCIFSRLDKEFLKNYIEDLKKRIIYIFGPPKMVEAVKEICLELGMIKENIKVESFMGY